LGEAGVHKKIEFEAWGIKDPELEKNSGLNFEDLLEKQQQALAIYAGNWMRDFSQVFVPTVFDKVKLLPRVIGPVLPTPIGPLGAESLIGSVLRAIAILSFDVEIPQKVMTDENIGVYVPEEHMDNPAGLKLDEHFLVRTTPNSKSDAKGHYVKASELEENELKKTTLGASGFDTLQVEDASLNKVDSLRMNHFIYNTSEWSKKQFRKSKNAAAAGNMDDARMFFGSGLHGIEDYFAHSNFIEVAINGIFSSPDIYVLPPQYNKTKKFEKKKGNRGRWVDPLYDGGENPKINITTGTFASGDDTVVSIAYILLSKMPKFFDIIDKGMNILLDRELDKILKIVRKKKTLEERRKEFEGKMKKYEIDYNGAEILNVLLEGMDKAKIQIPSFKTYTLPKDPHVTIPCTHLQIPHPRGHTVTVPCVHLQPPHPRGDTVTIPCTHLQIPHPRGHTVTVPCKHRVLQHPRGHIKFGVRVPCVHFKARHPKGDKIVRPCTHRPVRKHPKGHNMQRPCTHNPVPKHPKGDKIVRPCTHRPVRKHPKGHNIVRPCTHRPVPKHPKGDKIVERCIHNPVPKHPKGDRIKMSSTIYRKSNSLLLGAKIPVGITYDSPTNAFKTYREMNATGQKVWSHYLKVKNVLDFVNLPKQVQDWLTKTWVDITEEYRKTVRNYMKMALVSTLQFLVSDIPIQGSKEEDEYKLKGDYNKLLNLVKHKIDRIEINTFSSSMEDVRNYLDPKKEYKLHEIPFPPTHSEICKDHPRKNIKEKSHKYHLHGSIFYDIHFLLAKHAVQHITLEMNKYCERKYLINHDIPSNQREKFLKLNDDANNFSQMITKEAKRIDRTIYDDEMFSLFKIIDYYISHPVKTHWWRPIIYDYMKKYPEQVIDDINHRNKTRANRSR